MAKSGAQAASLSGRQLREMASQLGAVRAKVVSPQRVATWRWVRWKCQFGCGAYNSTLMCPPHTPTPSQTRRMLDEFSRAVLFESRPGQSKKIAAMLERRLFLAGCYRALGLGAGPCDLCEVCAMENGCRHPHVARPAMEACGIDVFATVRRHGFKIEVLHDRKAPEHNFGLVLVD